VQNLSCHLAEYYPHRQVLSWVNEYFSGYSFIHPYNARLAASQAA